MKTSANDLAYPLIDPSSGATATGLTKREYFAAMAMQGYLSCLNPHRPSSHQDTGFDDFADLSEISIKFADALIEELNKQEVKE